MKSFGEISVGLDFNPSGSGKVQKLKELFAEIIDIIHFYEKDNLGKGWYPSRHIAETAIAEAIGAQMWAEKAVTWKD